MTDDDSPLNPHEAISPESLVGKRVTVVYSMYHHLGDFVVMAGLLKKFDQLGVEFESLVAHAHSPHVESFDGDTAGRFFDVADLGGFFDLRRTLCEQRREGRLVLGIPMAPGSIQAFAFFWVLKKLGAVSHIVDFNLINADILTPVRRRYIFDRHLAQAAEIFKHPEWLDDTSMPLAIRCPAKKENGSARRIGFFPWSGRSQLPEFQWPEARWAELANRILASPGVEIVLLGRDENFSSFEQKLRAQLPPEKQSRFVARPAQTISALAADIRDLDGLVTLNTSALHIAHALKLPVVALCGSSGEFWLPEGKHVRLVRDTKGLLPPSDKMTHDPLQPSLQRIPIAEVDAACRELFQLSGAVVR